MIAPILFGLLWMGYFGITIIIGKWPEVAWKWSKWTFGVWWDRDNWTIFGIDVGPLEIVWHTEGYRP